jgi:hypothetical protein
VKGTLRSQLRTGSVSGAILRFAERRGGARSNPVTLVDKPRNVAGEAELRFLTFDDVESLLRAIPDDAWSSRVCALPDSRDDRDASLRASRAAVERYRLRSRVIRVRRSFTRGEFGPTKSRGSSRAVPLAASLVEERTALQNERVMSGTKILSSHIQRRVDHTIRRDSAGGSKPPRCELVSGLCVFTTCGTLLQPKWRQPARRSELSKRGWAIATSVPP